jgi:AcrR family transcriptional regulator
MAMSTRVSRPHRDEVRSRVLAAAVTVFAKRGFAAATIDEVAAAAGFTKGAVYSNFASKDELFLALMDAEVNARVELMRRVAAGAASTRQALAEIGDQLARAATDQPDWQLLFLEFWLRAVREPSVREKFVTHRRALRASIAETIRQAVADDQSAWKWPAEDTTVLLLALSNGFAIEALADPTSIPDGLLGRVLARFADGA